MQVLINVDYAQGHLLNDMFQTVIPAIYPIIKESLGLNFIQIGAITLTGRKEPANKEKAGS